MMSRRIGLIGALFLIVPLDSQAIIDPPTFTPAHPLSSQFVTMTVRTRTCHVFIEPQNELDVSISEGTLLILIDGIDEENITLCTFPEITYQFQIGQIPAGLYDVQIQVRDYEAPFLLSPPVSVGALTVIGGTESIPTTGVAWLLLLALLIMFLGSVNAVRRPNFAIHGRKRPSNTKME